MTPRERLLLVVATAASLAAPFALLWFEGNRPTPQAVSVAWLAAMSLLGSAASTPASGRELLSRFALAAILPMPGLWVTLTAHAGLDAAAAHAAALRVVLAFCVHAALMELLGAGRAGLPRVLVGLATTAGVTVCFALLLWQSGLPLSGALAAFTAALVVLRRTGARHA